MKNYNINKDTFIAAMDCGISQMRKRSIFLMTRKDLNLEWKFPEKEEIITLRDSIGNLPPLDPLLREGGEFTEKKFPKFKEKKPAQYDLRSQYNDEILKNLKVPLLAFTHPKDPFEGLTSDWLDQIDGMKRVVISKDYTIDGKKCFKLGKNKSDKFKVKDGHSMDQATCFQYYNPVILEYIESRI